MAVLDGFAVEQEVFIRRCRNNVSVYIPLYINAASTQTLARNPPAIADLVARQESDFVVGCASSSSERCSRKSASTRRGVMRQERRPRVKKPAQKASRARKGRPKRNNIFPYKLGTASAPLIASALTRMCGSLGPAALGNDSWALPGLRSEDQLVRPDNAARRQRAQTLQVAPRKRNRATLRCSRASCKAAN